MLPNTNSLMKKSAVLSILLLIIAACNNATESTTDTTKDSAAIVKPHAPDSVFIVPGYESAKTRIEELQKQLHFFKADNKARVEKLAAFFTPKEVYLEILRRAGDLNKDTLPYPVRQNYTRDEMTRIMDKNKALKPLTGNDILSLYKYVYPFAIIGQDDRYSVVYDPIKPQVKLPLSSPEMEDAKCVLAIIPKDSLKRNAQGNYVYQCTSTFGSRFGLCGESFANEPAFSIGTGFAVDSLKMVTAAHCIGTGNYKDYYFVFDFILDSNKYFHTIIDASKVYEAKSVVSDYNLLHKIDYSVVTLNKKVDAFRIRPLKRTGNTGMGKAYHVIGTPGGLPLKVAGSAMVKRNNHADYFTIMSDTYIGNSGSPVFNSETHEIEGILVNGARDFGFKEIDGVPCRFSLVCPLRCEDSPDGEIVSRVSQFLQHLVKKQ